MKPVIEAIAPIEVEPVAECVDGTEIPLDITADHLTFVENGRDRSIVCFVKFTRTATIRAIKFYIKGTKELAYHYHTGLLGCVLNVTASDALQVTMNSGLRVVQQDGRWTIYKT